MVGLKISPLRGLPDLWFALSYNLIIPSGLKKMTLKANQENVQVMFPIGLKTLFDGYWTNLEFLCDGYMIDGTGNQFKSLITNPFLCDGYVIGSPFLFDGHWTKEKL